MTPGAKSPARLQMYLILGIACLSLAGASVLFHWSAGAGGWGTTNHGRFVTPPTTIRDLGWRDENRTIADPEHWWIWQVSAGCDPRCLDLAQDLGKLHLLLNKEADRVRRGFTDLTGAASPIGGQVREIRVGDVDVERGIYVVDPIGNLVLYYADDVDPALILADLKRLLKVSQIG